MKIVSTLAVLAAVIAAPCHGGPATTRGDETPVVTDGMDETQVVELVVGESMLLSVGKRVERVVLVDPSVADAEPMDSDEVLLIGRQAGRTDVVFRLEGGGTIARKLEVGFDTDGLERQLQRLFGVFIEVEEIDGMLSLRGMLPGVEVSEQVARFMDRLDQRWVNLTRVPGVQQVQLRVRIAEANRTALRQLAFGGVVGGSSFFGGFQAPGAGTPFQRSSIAPRGGAPVSDPQFQFGPSSVSSTTTLFAGVPGANLEVFLQALDENQYVRLLAEPNLVAASGEEATFLVGGEFPIPVVQGSDAGGGATVTIEYTNFGTQLVFRPEVLGNGRIRLEVAPEVSNLSDIGALAQAGFQVPAVTTRRSSTTVELGNGQSFAMAGLLQTSEEGRISRVPLLGDLPVLGPVFRSVRYEQNQTELLVIVTAELVEPLDDGSVRPVPGDLHTVPDDWELFVEGRLEGTVAYNSPIARLEALGLGELVGPGAWRRPDERRRTASDPMPIAPAGGSDEEG